MAFRMVLRECRNVIVRDVRPEDLFPYLLQEEVISNEDAEVIMHEVSTRRRMELLLQVCFWSLTNAIQRNRNSGLPYNIYYTS